MNPTKLTKIILASICCLLINPLYAQNETYDVVFKDGRVIDPETNLDAIRYVGIKGQKIAIVSETPIKGSIEINAKGKILGPGFFDIHTHAVNVPSFWMQAYDGVTTSLELEMGAFPIKKAYEHAKTLRLPLNYGYSASWNGARMVVADGVTNLNGTVESIQSNFGKPNWSKLISQEKSAAVVNLLEQEMLDGGLGIGIMTGLAPKSNREEYVALANLVNKYDVPTYSHMRSKNIKEPDGAVEGFLETIGVAAGTGARMHMFHINSVAIKRINAVLPLVKVAQDKGIRITTEAYPWGAGSTFIGAPFLQPDKLAQIDMDPSKIMYVKTGERPATNERLNQLRATDPGGLAVVHYLDEQNPEEMKFIDAAILYKDTIIASDAVPYQINSKPYTKEELPIPPEAYAHPRSAATYSTVLARYVHDQKSMTLIDAFRRGSLLPANLVATSSTDAKFKGRIQAGMDADIIVFDLEKVKPKATYLDPRQPAQGMDFVMVNGQFIIKDGVLLKDSRPGKPIRSTLEKKINSAS